MRNTIRRWRSREIVLSAGLDYGYQARNEGKSLGHLLRGFEREGDLEGLIERTLVTDLPAELGRIYDLEVRARVIEIRPGSVTVFFGAVIAGLGVLSTYKDLIDSVRLIRRHSSALLARALHRTYGGDFDISIEVEYPRIEDWDDAAMLRRLRKGFPGGEEVARFLRYTAIPVVDRPSSRRDAFFWFLLVANIALVVVVGFLVGGAVFKTYF